MRQIDRSRVLDAQACPRKRYWAYEFQGTGIQKKSKGLALIFGGAVHEGLALLVQGKEIESAVTRAQLELSNAFEAQGVEVEDKSQVTLAMMEQGALAEGILRAWELHEGAQFRRDFTVIEVEEEGRVELADGIELMYRPDAVLTDKVGGDNFVLSWKTCSTYSQMTYNQASKDMQSLSEVYGVQQKLGITVEGVLYKYIVKGRRSLDEYTGLYRQDSHLIYGWVRKGVTSDEDEWAWKYGWATEEINAKTGKNVQTKLGKGFRKVSIWDNYSGGVKQWVDDLANQRIEPRHINALESIFPQSLPVSRRGDEIESWQRQVVQQELRIKQSIQRIDEWIPTDLEAEIDREFPQHTARCFDYMSKCQFYEACFTPSVKSDPLGSELYSIRVPNHPSEKGSDNE